MARKTKKRKKVVVLIEDITKKKKAEETLEESKEKFQSIVETIGDFIWEMDVNGVYTYCSPQIEKLWGFKPEKMIGKSPFDLLPPGGRKHAMKAFSSLIKSASSFENMEAPSFDSKGQIRFLEISGVPFFDTNGKLCGYRGVTRDITERKKTEKALKESEQKYKVIVENTPNFIFTMDRNNKVLSVNKAATMLFRKKPEEIIGKSIFELFPKEVASGYSKSLRNVFKTGEPYFSETEMVVGKNKLWISVTLSAVRNNKGKIVSVVGISKDITERKKAEDDMKSSEERLKILFEFAPDAMYLNDLKGTFVDGNMAAEKITGFKRKELIGKNFLKLKLLSKDQIPKAAAGLAKSALGKPTGPEQYTITRKNGRRVEVEISTFPVKIANRNLVLGTAHDITERKKAEEELRKRYEDIEKFSKVAVGRELKMIELKNKIKILERRIRTLEGKS